MKRLASLAVFALLAGCASQPTSSQQGGPAVGPNSVAAMVGGPAGQVTKGGTYWTRTNLRIIKGTAMDSDSWLSGEFLPMGTQVTVKDTAKSDTRWNISLSDGREFWIYVGYGAGYKDVFQEIQKFLAPQDPKAGFDAGSGAVADAIRNAKPVEGMTRAQALAALGFPAKITDPALSNEWRYPQRGRGWRTHGWATAYDHRTVTLHFEGDVVKRVSGYEED